MEANGPPWAEIWEKWEGHVIDGAFPLRRWLGGSDHGGVFLTEYPAKGLPTAALKLVPAIPTIAQLQLSQWTAAAELSHPYLIRLFDTGRWRLGGLEYLYVVMEYAEQSLAQLLARRALTTEETREMLPKILDVLEFLHGRGFVHGQLKPSNILVVDDRLKLASDSARPVAQAAASVTMSSTYDPPEARDGSFSPAGDVWALGATVAAALTQARPLTLNGPGGSAALPPDFPPAFANIVRRCLSRDPADRPTLTELQDWTKQGSRDSTVATVPAGRPAERLVIRAVISEPTPPQESPSRRSRIPVILGAVAAVAVSGIIVFVLTRHPETKPAVAVPPVEPAAAPTAAAVAAPTAAASTATTAAVAAPPAAATAVATTVAAASNAAESAPAPVPAPASDLQSTPLSTAPVNPSPAAANPVSPPSAADDRATVHEEIPNVPRNARATIHGHIKVSVAVRVDSQGRVIQAVVKEPGPSRYFAKLAVDAAGKWVFAPTEDRSVGEWLLRFDFSRAGTTVQALRPPVGR